MADEHVELQLGVSGGVGLVSLAGSVEPGAPFVGELGLAAAVAVVVAAARGAHVGAVHLPAGV